MGLRDIVIPGSGELAFDTDSLRNIDIGHLPDTILRTVKNYDWARETMNAFTDVFTMTYDALGLKSKDMADEWFEQILKRHGAFLADQGMLTAMPKQVKIPEVLKKLQSGRIHLFQEEKPSEVYQLLKEMESGGKYFGRVRGSLASSHLNVGQKRNLWNLMLKDDKGRKVPALHLLPYDQNVEHSGYDANKNPQALSPEYMFE